MNICEHCGYHLKMRNSDRIELSIDPGTWNPMDEDMVSMDPIEFHSEEESESCAAVAAESSTEHDIALLSKRAGQKIERYFVLE
ncbi:hypothetical protein Ahy_A10g049175 [Arachis hypogaea]|uniref:CoA carboxyltransferase N-terminal domain-containing protein n=1 Tax=Arachis hypogaea TaxID=3818 RepID=A0A445B6M3_ARAHY|nr:hypothetical protein Ahy_A10g049175 [Arachis hypogaea]